VNSPFKFLDAYTIDDRQAFFGREEEVAALYDMVTRNRLILVYGQSGTGKTSLIQCGLAARFDATDWYPLFIRRQTDINQSLAQRLRQASGLDDYGTAVDALEEIYVAGLRPVYFIFDQLEELFILGKPDERATFIQTIRDILSSSLPCRILFVMREEYLAYLYGFEKTIPTLFDRRLRVEPMSTTKVKSVLEGSFRQFNIRVQAPEAENLLRIIDNISGGRAGIQLPYLQVYLDSLYREDFTRTYPNRENPAGEWLPLEFTRTEIDAMGKIENVLEKFLQEQQLEIQRRLERQFPKTAGDAVQKVLDAFVSEEGTKRPVGFERRGDDLIVEKRWADLFRPLTPQTLGACCQLLEQARLLRVADEHLELAHDALAILIDKQRSGQQRRLNETLRRLQHNYREFADTGEYLTRRQLNAVEELLPLLEDRLDDDIKKYVADSLRHAEKTEHAELEEERRKRKQARRVAIVGLTLAAIALIGFVLAWVQFLAANRAKIEIARNAMQAQRNIATALKMDGKYAEALQQLQGTEQFVSVLKTSEQTEIQQLRGKWQQVQRYMTAGDSLTAGGDLRAALAQYGEAQKTDRDDRIDNRIAQTTRDIETKFQEYRLFGDALYNAKKYDLAMQNFEKALRLKPGDAEVARKLELCRQR